MKYVPNDDSVNLGERVITSGMDRIFPRDLPVGHRRGNKPGNPFKQIRVLNRLPISNGWRKYSFFCRFVRSR